MCDVLEVIGGPSTAEVLRAIEWHGSPEQPMLNFKMTAGHVIESEAYIVYLVTAELFVVSVRTTSGDEMEIIWNPAKQHGRCILVMAYV